MLQSPELGLVKLVAGHFCLTDVFAHKGSLLLAHAVEGGRRHREVAEEFLLLRLESDLRVPEDEKEVVVGHHGHLGLLLHIEVEAVGHREQDSPTQASLLGLVFVHLLDGEHGVAADHVVVRESDEDDEVLLAVDVLMEVDRVLGVVAVDQFALIDSPLREPIYRIDHESHLLSLKDFAPSEELYLVVELLELT